MLAWAAVPTEAANPTGPHPVTLHVRNLTTTTYTTSLVEWRWWQNHHESPQASDSGTLESFSVPAGEELTRTIAPVFPTTARVRFTLHGTDPGLLVAEKVVGWRRPVLQLDVAWPSVHVAGTPLTIPYTITNPNPYDYSGELVLRERWTGLLVSLPVTIPTGATSGGDLVFTAPSGEGSFYTIAEVQSPTSRGPLIAASDGSWIEYRRSTIVAERLAATAEPGGGIRAGARISVPVGGIGFQDGTVTLTARVGTSSVSESFPLALQPGENEELTLATPFGVAAFEQLRLEWSQFDETRGPASARTGAFIYSKLISITPSPLTTPLPVGSTASLQGTAVAGELPFSGTLEITGPLGPVWTEQVSLAPTELRAFTIPAILPPAALASPERETTYAWRLIDGSGGSVASRQRVRVAALDLTVSLVEPAGGWRTGEVNATTVSIANNATHLAEIPVDVEVYSPTLGILDTASGMIALTGAVALPVEVPLPSAQSDVDYRLTTRIRLAGGGRYLWFASSVARTYGPRCSLALALGPDPVLPGALLAIDVANAGSGAVTARTTWQLLSSSGAEVAEGSQVVALGVGASVGVPVPIPSPLPSGTYSLATFTVDDTSEAPLGALSVLVTVLGDEANLAVATDQGSYASFEEIGLSAALVPGSQGLAAGAELLLRVTRLAAVGGEAGWQSCFGSPATDAEAIPPPSLEAPATSRDIWLVSGLDLVRVDADLCEASEVVPVGSVVSALAVVGGSDVWLASEAEAMHFDGTSFDVTIPLPGASGEVVELGSSPDGSLWLLRRGASDLIRIQSGVATTVPGPAAGALSALEVAPDGTVWVLSGTALWQRDGAAWVEHAPPFALDPGPAPGPHLLVAHPDGSLWVAGRSSTSELSPVALRFEPSSSDWSEAAIPFLFPGECYDDSFAALGLSAQGQLLAGITYLCPGVGTSPQRSESRELEVFLASAAGFRSLGATEVANVESIPWRLFGSAGEVVWLVDGDSLSRQASGQHTLVWERTDLFGALAPGEAVDLADSLPDGLEPGAYSLSGELSSGGSFPIAHALAPFFVQESELEIDLETALPGTPAAVSASLAFTARVRNLGADPILDLVLAVRAVSPAGAEIVLASLPIAELAPGQEVALAAGLLLEEEGVHSVVADLLAEAGTLSLASRLVEQESVLGVVVVSVPPPAEAVEGVTSSLPIDTRNLTAAPLSLNVALLPSDPTRPPVPIAIPPFGIVRSEVPIGILPASGNFVASVSGQAESQADVAIVRAGNLSLSVGLEAAYQAGDAVVPMTVTNLGATTGYSLEWRLDGDLVGQDAGTLARSEARDLLPTLALAAGTHTLTVSVTGQDPQVLLLEVLPADLAEILNPQISAVVEGTVPLSFTIMNPSPFDEQLTVVARAGAGTGPAVERTELLDLGPGQEAPVELAFELSAGFYTMTIQAGQAIYTAPLTLLPRTAGEVTLSVLERIPGRATVQAVIENTGADPWSGEIVGSGLLAGFLKDVNDLLPGATMSAEWLLPLEELPAGPQYAGATAYSNGEVLGAAELSILVAPPAVTLVGAALPPTIAAGDIALFQVTLANGGDLPETLTFDLDGGGLGRSRVSFELAPTSGYVVTQALAIPFGLSSGAYSIGYLIRTAGGVTVASGGIGFTVDGLAAEVTVALDQTAYDDGAPIGALFTINVSGPAIGSGYELRAAYDGEAEIFSVDLSTGSVAVPATFVAAVDGGKLAFGLYDANGQALVLDAAYIRVRSGGLLFHTDKDRYLPGESVALTVDSDEPGALTAFFFEAEITAETSGSSQISVPVPTDAPSGTYPITVRLVGESGVTHTASVPIDVDGLRIRVVDQRFSQESFESGDVIGAEITLLSSTTTTATIEAALLDPNGEEIALPTQPAALEAEIRTIVPLSYTLVGTVPGHYELQLTVVDESDWAQGGAGTLLAFHSPFLVLATLDPALSVEDGEVAHLLYSAAGEGAALLTLELDGVEVYSTPIQLNGFLQGSIPLDAVPFGYHEGTLFLEGPQYTSTLPLALQIGEAPMELPPAPDLVVGAGSLSVKQLPSGSLSIAGEVRNEGDLPAGASLLRLSAGVLGDLPVQIGTISVGVVEPGQAAPFLVEWNAASYLEPVRVTAIADADNEVEERFEWNNEGSGFIELSALGVAVAVSPSTIGANETAVVSVWTKNRSDAPLEDVSVDLKILNGPIVGGSVQWFLPNLAAGQIFSADYTFESLLKPAGDYLCQLTVRTDSDLVTIVTEVLTIEGSGFFSGALSLAWTASLDLSVDYTVSSASNLPVNIGGIELEIYDHDSGALMNTLTLAGWLPPGGQITRSEVYSEDLPEGLYDGHLLVLGDLVAQDTFAVSTSTMIFADGFESGDTDEWSGTLGGLP